MNNDLQNLPENQPLRQFDPTSIDDKAHITSDLQGRNAVHYRPPESSSVAYKAIWQKLQENIRQLSILPPNASNKEALRDEIQHQYKLLKTLEKRKEQQTPQNAMARLEQILGASAIPKEEIEDLQRAFLNPQDLIHFNNTVPLFYSGMQQLRENYECWDSVKDHPDKLQELKGKIKIQQANLVKLAIELKKSEGNQQQLLTQLTYTDKFAPYFSGDQEFKELNLRGVIKDKIRQILKESPELSASIQQARQASPLSKIALEGMAQVFAVERAARQPQVEMDRLQNLLGIRTASNTTKQAFLSTHMKSAKPHDFVFFDQTVPLFHAGMKQLKESYAQWDSVENDPSALKQLKQKIMNQHTNLTMLAKVLKAVCAVDERLLNERLLLLSQLKSAGDLSKFFSGELPLDETNLMISINGKLHEIKMRIKEKTPDILTTKQPFRQESPMQEVKLTQKLGSANIVTQITTHKGPGTSESPVAFLKQGSGGEMASGIMERLVWDIAVIMGVENQFTPTKQTSVQGATGGIQPTQEGKTLKRWMEGAGKIKIKFDTLVSGVLRSILFGMFDAHGDNIIVDQQGNIKFFDNTRSLPHTNGFIDRGDHLVSPFRCALLSLVESDGGLYSLEVEQIKKELVAYEAKISALEKFLRSPQTQAQIAKLPPGWLYPVEALDAMKERIAALRKVLAANQMLSLRELALRSNPAFKFNIALQMVWELTQSGITPTTYSQADLLKIVFNNAGHESIEKLLDNCVFEGINPKDILDLCNDPALSIHEISNKIVAMLESSHMMNADLNANEAAATKLKRELRFKAKQDFKDFDRQSIGETIIDNMHVNMVNAFPVNFSKESSHLNDIPPRGSYQLYSLHPITPGDPPTLHLLATDYQDKQPKRFQLDYSSIPGKFIVKSAEGIELPPMAMAELKEFLDISISNYYAVDEEQANRMLANNEWLARPSSHPARIVVQYKKDDQISEIVLARTVKKDEYFVISGIVGYHNIGKHQLLDILGKEGIFPVNARLKLPDTL